MASGPGWVDRYMELELVFTKQVGVASHLLVYPIFPKWCG